MRQKTHTAPLDNTLSAIVCQFENRVFRASVMVPIVNCQPIAMVRFPYGWSPRNGSVVGPPARCDMAALGSRSWAQENLRVVLSQMLGCPRARGPAGQGALHFLIGWYMLITAQADFRPSMAELTMPPA